MNLAGMVAGLMDAEGFGAVLVRFRQFAAGELAGVSDEEWQASLAERRAAGWKVLDWTGRRVAPADPKELEALTIAANAASVRGQLDAMRSSAADQEPESEPRPGRSIDVYRYVDLARERERRGLPAITLPDSQIIP